VIADADQGYRGPLAGILAGMDWARRDPAATHLVSVAGDTPFFPRDLVAVLAEGADGRSARIVMAASGGRRHPVFALWPLSLAGALREFLAGGAKAGVAAFAEEHDCVACDFPLIKVGAATVDPFLNINTPADLARAQQLFSEARKT
jgi:molybdopterin-guanine dinucleotide biosynthesis protein A